MKINEVEALVGITKKNIRFYEEQGLLKMDFLGLRTLTIIKNALNMIKKNHGIDIDMMKIPLDDPKTFEMLQRGDTVAVFQLESGGMQNLCRSFGVETLEHIIALLAIYRPGPMQFIPDFIARKKGEAQIIYDHPLMEDCLKETYGIMLYQEQIMQVVQVLAGFTLGGADILRRAIGKKKVDVLAKQKEKFFKGCKETNNIDEALTLGDRIYTMKNKLPGTLCNTYKVDLARPREPTDRAFLRLRQQIIDESELVL